MIDRRQSFGQIRKAAHDWRAVINDHDPSADQLAAFEAWLAADIRHQEAYDRAVTVWSASDYLVVSDLDHELREEAIERTVFAKFVHSLARVSRPVALATAAVVLLAGIIGAVVAVPNMDAKNPNVEGSLLIAKYETGIGEIRSITLSDGSNVTLGPASELEFLESEIERRVTLRGGDAFFDVAHDPQRPFSASANGLTATALGTAFDVRATQDTTRVSVLEGRVEVRHALILDGKESSLSMRKVLERGDRVRASQWRGLGPVQAGAIDAIASWRDYNLTYEDAPLSELVADINRYDRREIILIDKTRLVSDLRLTAAFDSRDADGMLSMIAAAFPVTLTNQADGTILVLPSVSEFQE